MSTSAEPSTNRPGRRPTSSRAAIEEAAGELFLENTYAKTTVDQVAQRAGVSRASFFNYFAAKSDLLWGDVDLLVDDVAARLAAQSHDLSPMESVRTALVQAAAEIGTDRIPLAATQWELMGARAELLASGLQRFARLAEVIRRHLDSRCSETGSVLLTGPASLLTGPASFAVVGAAMAAASDWAGGGPGRARLAEILDAAITPVCSGYEAACA